jgi:hypothetical protein
MHPFCARVVRVTLHMMVAGRLAGLAAFRAFWFWIRVHLNSIPLTRTCRRKQKQIML